MRKIVVINQKGGAGKTTTAATLASGLARKGRSVLLIDLDPQGSLAVWFALSFGKSLYHALTKEADAHDCLYPVADGLDLLPSNKTLAQAELTLATRPERERALEEILAPINGYDYVILDCAPSLTILNINGMLYADEAYVPVSMDYLSLVGAREMLDNVRWLREKLGATLAIGSIIPTFYDKRDRKSQDVIETLRKHFGDQVADPIRKNVKLAEAVGAHKDIFSFAPGSYGATDYEKLVTRTLHGEG